MGIGAWESGASFPKVAICIPHTGLVRTTWSINFRLLWLPPVTEIIEKSGYAIHFARNQLVDAARKSKCDYIFFLDSDVIIPQNTLAILLQDNLPIVSGVYRNKIDFLAAAWRKVEDPRIEGYSPIKEYDQSSPINYVDVVGMGCCLIQAKVFDKISFPWFDWTLDMYQKKGRGEDFFFCEKVMRETGIKIAVDSRIACRHLIDGSLNHEQFNIVKDNL